MESQVDQFKAAIIKQIVSDLQKADPKLTFVQAWNRVAREHPDLFETQPGWDPETGDQYGQLRQPKLSGYADPYSRDKSGRTYRYGEPLKASDTPWLDLWVELRRAELVEASQEGAEIICCSFAGTETIDSPKRTIQYMPAGTHEITARISGQPGTRVVHVDAKAARRLQEALSERLRQNVVPHCGFDHRSGPASFLPREFSWDPNRGILLSVDWTSAGRKAVLGRDYNYFSPTFLLGPDGEIHGLPKHGEIGSLTNSPAFEAIERLAASYAYA